VCCRGWNSTISPTYHRHRGVSTELVLGDGQEPRSLSSTKVGAVRHCGIRPTDPISNAEFQYLQYVRGRWSALLRNLRLRSDRVPRLVGTSGTIESLATIHAREGSGIVPPLQWLRFFPQRPGGVGPPLAGSWELFRTCRDSRCQGRRKRQEIILAGAVILQEAMTLLGIELTVCERSLRKE